MVKHYHIFANTVDNEATDYFHPHLQPVAQVHFNEAASSSSTSS